MTKRLASHFLTLWFLGLLFCYPSHADDAEAIVGSTNAAAQLYHAGDVLAAKEALEQIALQEPTEGSRQAHRYALITLIEICHLTPPKQVAFDGRSFKRQLYKPKTNLPGRILFVEKQRTFMPEKWAKAVATKRPAWYHYI